MDVPRLTPDELDTLARRAVTNEVFITNTADGYQFSFSAVLMFLDLPVETADQVGALWEELSKAGPTGINGYPFFTSCHLVHRKDVMPLLAAIEAKQAALNVRIS